MAVERLTTDLKLQVRVETGDTKNGKAVLKNLNFNKIRADATREELLAAGEAIAGLQSLTLSEIRSIDTGTLTKTQ